MRVRDMMDHLAAGPSPIAIRRIELFVGESIDRLSKAGRCLADAGDLPCALVSCRHTISHVVYAAAGSRRLECETRKLTLWQARK